MDGGTLTWHDFLDRMRQPSSAEFVKSIKSFVISFSNSSPDPEKDSATVQEFLSTMEEAFRAHPLWAGSSEEELDGACEGLEKYLMTKLYNRVFASAPEDARSDEDLFEKISLLQQFIKPENLDIRPEYQNETSWLLAQKDLQRINMYKAPREKLMCILNCCKVINNLLLNAASYDTPPGADEFLPVLIYVTIKANPPQLHSNLQYIERYRRRSRLASEAAYYFTNIVSAESFIWNIDAQSLSMDDVEFQKKMDSAREQILGLSNHVDSQSSHMAGTDKLKPPKTSEDDFTMKEQRVQTVAQNTSRDSSAGKSVAEVEKEGRAELLREEDVAKHFQEYPFLFARSGDLTVEDVEELLNCYKQVVLKYVSLSKGMGIGAESQFVPSTHVASRTDTITEPSLFAPTVSNPDFSTKSNEKSMAAAADLESVTETPGIPESHKNVSQETVLADTDSYDTEKSTPDLFGDMVVLNQENPHQSEHT